MKINKKVLIPLFATAMGLSAIGGISGSVAWYQYNTKVSGSWMGVSTADGGVLQIYDGSNWKRDASYGTSSDVLHPVTFGGLDKDASLSGKQAYKHPQAGPDYAQMTSWDAADVDDDYVQFTVQIRALKLDLTATTDADRYVPAPNKPIKLEEMIIESATTNKTAVGAAVRVHISDGTTHKLFSIGGNTVATKAKLDLDMDTELDEVGGYVWEYDDTDIEYGDTNNNSQQTSYAIDALEDQTLFTTDSNGLVSLTVTIWLEGWQQIEGSSIWDASRDAEATIHFGMKLYTPKDSFLAD
jgi:hypothetical protein